MFSNADSRYLFVQTIESQSKTRLQRSMPYGPREYPEGTHNQSYLRP